MKLRHLIKCGIGALFATQAFAGTIVYNTYRSDPVQLAATEQAVKDFEAAHPNIKVKLNRFDHNGYKSAIRNFLIADAPDVADWFPGNRMKPFVDAGLFDPIDDVWAANNLQENMASSIGASTINGKKYALPFYYYNWGVYYRKDIFAKLGIDIPKDWDAFVAAGKKIRASGIAPITIGTKNLWPAGGVFDYLNLRTNGYDFHMALTGGQVSWEDPRVKEVFKNWKVLLDNDFWVAGHTTRTWQEGLTAFVQGDAAMYVIGHFAVKNAVEAGLDISKIGYFQFPIITSGIPVAEEAPIGSLHIPSKAKNKADAKVFLAWIANPAVQSKYSKAVGQLPTHKDAVVDGTVDPMLPVHAKMLSKVDGGIAQFFDRDTPAEMAKVAMEGFQEFMVKPDNADKILARTEKFRKKYYKIK